MLLGVYALYSGWHSERRAAAIGRNIASVALICAGAIALAAVQVIPTIDHVRDSVRAEPFNFDLVSVWTDGASRRAPGFRVVSYPTARGCAAAHVPEANVRVPLDSTADTSNTPT